MRRYTEWHLEMEDNDEDYEGEYHKSAYDWRVGIKESENKDEKGLQPSENTVIYTSVTSNHLNK